MEAIDIQIKLWQVIAVDKIYFGGLQTQHVPGTTHVSQSYCLIG